MTLNTYAAYLPYLTIPPRGSVSKHDTVMVFLKSCMLLTGRIWHGYDEGAMFEADAKVWLHPMFNNAFTGSVYLGGVYQHRHSTISPRPLNIPFGTKYNLTSPMQNDYYHLEELRDLAPIAVHAGSEISIDRDFFNIEYAGSPNFNAWDIELVIVVDE